MPDKSSFLFLYGAPASGKSTLGRALGQALKLPWIDLDQAIVNHAGHTIPEIFSSEGEAAFRQLESEVLQQVFHHHLGSACIISLGGGTLLREENRKCCEAVGTVICLDTPSEEELARRIAQGPGERPLGNRARERAQHYASFSNRVAAFFQMERSLILVGQGIAPLFLHPSQTVFDETVARLYPKLSTGALGIIPSGEENKTPETVGSLWHQFALAGIGRKSQVMACGGGVTGDLTGFAAATWMRGIDWINIPTTLLAMIDASVGGKTGCDLPEGKNLAGAFHSPRLVVIDTEFLKTVPERQLRSGWAEMIKHFVIGSMGRPVVKNLQPSADEIAKNLAVKVQIVAEDPFETKGRRLLLNCGHTIGHALETWSRYGNSHGEAVAIGCVEEARLAAKLKLADTTWPKELASIFETVGLPVSLPQNVTLNDLIPLMKGDKKKETNGVVTFALPCGWGDCRAVTLNLAELSTPFPKIS